MKLPISGSINTLNDIERDKLEQPIFETTKINASIKQFKMSALGSFK